MSDTDSSLSDTEQELAHMLHSFIQRRAKEEEITETSNQTLASSPPLSATFSTLSLSNDSRQPPDGLKTRFDKLSTEHIRLISSEMNEYMREHRFKVRGSTGKVYNVIVGPKLTCNCRDYEIRQLHCKHLLYVLFKEMKVEDMSSSIYTTTAPSDELLKSMFSCYHPRA